MRQSSESVAALAAALAKAQTELINPEKSLIATIPSGRAGEGTRSFRYAPLSSGLDIVRKSLGRHEIATIQSTEIDSEARLLRLTTILAHSSGEWISSEWPVCPINDIVSAQRMGAALTYARRYALFALVGIAGEDDLDAPDLGADSNPAAELPLARDHRKQSNGQGSAAQRMPRDAGFPRSPARSILGEQLSASLRESLVQQMAALTSEDETAAWAHRNLPAKNTLAAADAKIVEERFQARLSEIGDGRDRVFPSSGGEPLGGTIADDPHAVPDQRIVSGASADAVSSEKAAAAVLKRPRRSAVGPLGKTVRLRDKDHRKFVLRQPCLVCGRVPSDPHHLTFTQPRALGRRVSDEFTVPVCRIHHRELHRSGDEAAWWRRLNIDPLSVALKLWQHSRADGELSPLAQGVTQPQPVKKSAHDLPGASGDPNTHT